jgi:hypothetical protein
MNTKSKLTAWLEANAETASARECTYLLFPENFTWHAGTKNGINEKVPLEKLAA